MASVPPCGLGCRIKKVHKYLKYQKSKFLIYSIFYLLIIELSSYSIRDFRNYACFWYPLLTQLGYALLTFSIFLWSEKLGFCFRKNIAILGLCIYYLLGFVSLIFGCSENLYIQLTLGILFLISLIAILLTIFKNE